jgi:hypothetical protein
MHKFDYELIFILIIVIFLTLFYIVEFKNSIRSIYYLIFYSPNFGNEYTYDIPIVSGETKRREGPNANLNNNILSESINQI